MRFTRFSVKAVSLLFLLLAVPSAFADEQKPKSPHQFFLKQFYTDMSYLMHEPDFYLVMGSLNGAPALFHSAFVHEDPEFTEMWKHSATADHLFESGGIIGNGVFPMSIAAASWGVGKISKSNKLRDFGTDLFRAQAVNDLLTGVMKFSINRTRPDGTPYSYPSGHTSTTFAMAGVVYKHFGKVWGFSAFGVATYVGFSRLQENKHYLSDIIAGGILGSYVSLKLSKHDTRGNSLSLAPYTNHDASGVEMTLSF